MKFFIGVFIGIVLVGLQFESHSQNLLENGDFTMNGGSLYGWGTASGTSLGSDNGDYFAVLHGENGVLYQKVTNVIPGKTYTCTMSFRNLKVKQTTGYGFVIEFDTPLVLPEFTIGATNLKTFCQGNNGDWTTLEDNLVEQNVTKSYNILIPENAKAVYICIGTKGAVADMQIDAIDFQTVAATNVTFLVKNKATGDPLENAEVLISGFSNFIATDAKGKAVIELVPSDEPYSFKVSRDWFQSVESSVIIGETEQSLIVEMDSIQEEKTVETRISKYGDNATPYPIFGHFWSSGLDYSDEIVDSITKTLDYIVGGSGLDNTKTVSDKLHQFDPDFQIIRYQGGWDIKASLLGDQKFDLLYYRCGMLAETISESDITVVLNATPDKKGLGLVASKSGSFDTWIRIEDELMKIVAVSGSSYPLTLTVERGFEGSTSVSHTGGMTATASLFSTIPNPGGNNSNLSFFDPVFGKRKADLLNNSLAVANESGQDGIWIDILVGLLGAQNMVGGNYTLWDHDTESVLTNEVIVKKTKDALNDIYNGFYARMGYYPVIYGNNVLYSSSMNEGDRAYVMVKTEEHPRGLDGFCHENSWGHMSDDSGNIDNDGDPISTNDKFIVLGENGHYLEWYMGNSWLKNCKSIALLAENNLPNQPMTINAGFKNQWFAADLSDQTRYDFNKYAYASYLLCVNVTSDSLISCRMGISPQVLDRGMTTINFEPYFYYPIGIPVAFNNSSNFERYRVGSSNLYARQFSNGIVLVNPFATDMNAPVSMGEIGEEDKVYIDPGNDDSEIHSIQLKSRETKILIAKSLNTGNSELQLPAKNSLKIYPNPVQNEVHLAIPGSTSAGNKSFNIELYTQTGEMARIYNAILSGGQIRLSTEDLSPGIYFVRIPQFNLAGKLVKTGN